MRISPTLVSQDIPTEMSLAITSENGWQGFIMDDWPQIKPKTFRIPIKNNKQSRWYFKVSQTDYLFMKGTTLMSRINVQA